MEDIRKSQLAEHEADGWVVDRELKYKLKMRKEKAHDIAFEDRVWATLARLQFPRLNSGRSFRLRYGAAKNEAQQVDVFAADDEVVLIVECKSTTSIGKPGQFKTEIEAITGKREGILKHLRHEYPQHKVKFLLATNNYTLSDAVQERVAAAHVFHIDEDAVEYYLTLAGHLGAAAKYQLLGALLDFRTFGVLRCRTAVGGVVGRRRLVWAPEQSLWRRSIGGLLEAVGVTKVH
ncbi:MAG: hypothetical protein ACRDK7_01975 [Solirubrobacteraceae bacterium]